MPARGGGAAAGYLLGGTAGPRVNRGPVPSVQRLLRQTPAATVARLGNCGTVLTDGQILVDDRPVLVDDVRDSAHIGGLALTGAALTSRAAVLQPCRISSVVPPLQGRHGCVTAARGRRPQTAPAALESDRAPLTIRAAVLHACRSSSAVPQFFSRAAVLQPCRSSSAVPAALEFDRGAVGHPCRSCSVVPLLQLWHR